LISAHTAYIYSQKPPNSPFKHPRQMKRLLLLFYFPFLLCLNRFEIQAQVSVLTQHNDLNRSGWNARESILNLKNVNKDQFGTLFTRNVDAQIYAQPLVVSNVSLGNGIHNVVYVATVSNSLYAFDADSVGLSQPYWQVNLTAPGSRPIRNSDMTGACGGFYQDFSSNMGIVGTPVIDSSTQTLFVVARSVSTDGSMNFMQYLHAIDIRTGKEKTNSPVLITAQINSLSGDGAANGILNFNPQTQNQRPGLLLLNGTVYIAYASHCDWNPYHGWFLGYDTASLLQTIVYNTTPEGSQGGIWMSGAAPAADELGNIYLAVGNGTTGIQGNPGDSLNKGETALKLTRNGNRLAIASFFTPYNFDNLNTADLDLGVTEVMLIPHSNYAVTGGKDGNLYLLNRDNMGGYNPNSNAIQQTVNLGSASTLHSSLAYYKGQSGEFIYTWSENASLNGFLFDTTSHTFNLQAPLTGPPGPTGNNGALLAVSSNGSDDSTAILWASHAASGDANQGTRPGLVRAFAAGDLTRELWNSSMDPADDPGNYAKFVCPTVANGKVYMASFSNKLVVYGLVNKAVANCVSANIALNKSGGASSIESPAYPVSYAFDGQATTRWSSQFSDPQNIDVDLGQKYKICRIILKWERALGRDFMIQTSDDSVNWTTVQTLYGNTSYFNSFDINASGRFVRMYGIARGTIYGYSLYEFEVYGTPLGSIHTSGLPLVYPNPAKDWVIVEKGRDNMLGVSMFDESGRMVRKLDNESNSALISLAVTTLAKGFYVVEVKTTAGTYRFKIIH